MSFHVHFVRPDISDTIDALQAHLDPSVQITSGKEIPNPANYHVLINPYPSTEWIEASPNLKAIVVPWAGVPEKTREIMANYPDISLHNLHYNRFNTAEMGLALLLAAAKFLVPMDQALRQNDWRPRYQETKAILLRGKTVLILGFGAIGQALGAYCQALGMKLMATKKHPENYAGDLEVALHPDDELQSLLPETDVLLIALPLTEETENLICEEELLLMPKGSILVNVGRGPVVNQHALYDALTSGHLRSAGSDVWYNYPENTDSRKNTPPAEVPFGDLENFVLSPHRGGMVENNSQQQLEALADMINLAARGENIPNKIDLEAGY